MVLLGEASMFCASQLMDIYNNIFFLTGQKKNSKIYFFKSLQIYMKDAECVETIEKSILQFFIFELW